ncbi:MAG: DUF2723 domain-containing protein [Bacteroidales bacterium]|nr:DUF2723 domain-containing protein [Bacteroidales bacterium]
MKSYNLINNVLGWVVFLIAAVVYLMTMEPTASFWDCGEFITSAYKLEVGHPPGAPFFMLTGNLFTQLTSDPAKVAMMVNSMSAIFSALTILFLFWTITYMARKIVVKGDDDLSLGNLIMIMGAGVVGALVYTFSDTFWFSAVEGEVYAYSSLFTALVFWLILKWESFADRPHADRWLILIAYFMGLSIGVHLLNLLCIPAIVLVYYFKKFPNPTLKGTLIALLVSFAIVGLMLYGFIQGLVEVCGWFELLFVNVLGMPFNSGVVIYLIVVTLALIWGLYESSRPVIRPVLSKCAFLASIVLLGIPFFGEGIWLGIILILAFGFFLFTRKFVNVRLLNTTLSMMLVLLIGYSSYAVILIRSSANPPMDQNSPNDIFTLGSYLNREQYGDRPLFYGETYASEVERKNENGASVPVVEQGPAIWKRGLKKSENDKDVYVVAGHKEHYVYDPQSNMLFPRMYSKTPSHIAFYKEIAQIKGNKPTFMENLRFFFKYQLNFMYWRYFMWNFSGRQNDIQGFGEITNGNWITGIPFIDSLIVGPQTDMPYDIINNKGHNKYYLLPLILGLVGLIYQACSGKKGEQGFWITFFLFFMTGIAIVIYLNQTPYQPRERDYAYAGSFYAFSIWVGLGVLGLTKLLMSLKLNKTAAASVASLLAVGVPIQMAGQNWDDHDRSGRYVCRDFGMNYLSSCAPNAIIFTNGDNDTFPLWYVQEVEGYRTDVRVCNLSYLQTDWYISQMKRQAYNSAPLPIDWNADQYQQGTKDIAWVVNTVKRPILLSEAMEFLKSDNPRTKQIPGVVDVIDYIPSDQLLLPVNKEEVLRVGAVAETDSADIVSQVDINLTGKNNLMKQELMVLDMLLNNNWERPIYYAVTVGEDQGLNLNNYFQLTGLAKRIVPMNVTASGTEVNMDVMFDNMMHKFKWGNVADPKVYLDENVLRMCQTARYMFVRLVEALIKEGKDEKALEALNYCMEVLPPSQVPLTSFAGLALGNLYFQVDRPEEAENIYKQIADNSSRNLDWFFRLRKRDFASVLSDVEQNLAMLQHIASVTREYAPELSKKYSDELGNYAMEYNILLEKYNIDRLGQR